MGKIAIVTDSAAGLTPKEIGQFDISVVPLNINFFDGTAEKDLPGADKHHFYQNLIHLEKTPTTSTPTPEDFRAVFENRLRDHSAIIAILMAEELSSTINQARVAAGEIDPSNKKILVIDSRMASAPEALVVIEAAKLAKAGKDTKQILESINDSIKDVDIFQTAKDLSYLRKGGRIGLAQGFVAGVFDILPILTLRDGTVTGLKKVRGEKKVIKTMVQMVKETVGNRPLSVAFVHAMAEMEANLLQDEAKRVLNCQEIYFFEQTMVISAHTGPMTYGFAFLPKR